MPYGDLEAQKVQRFAKIEDLRAAPLHDRGDGGVRAAHRRRKRHLFGGVDYEAIVRTAEQRDNPDVILFDGGNNDMPFYQADLKVVVVDPLRAGHEVGYYPGEANLRMADVVVINKMDSASPQQLKIVRDNIHRLAPDAVVVEADSELTLDGEIKGKRVLVIEDGPTLTHGEMQIGAAMVAAKRFGAAKIVEPRHNAVGKIAETYLQISQHRPGHPAGHGLFRPAEARPSGHDQRHRRRHRAERHAHRSDADRHGQQAGRPGEIRFEAAGRQPRTAGQGHSGQGVCG